jgi:hypothetical protein
MLSRIFFFSGLLLILFSCGSENSDFLVDKPSLDPAEIAAQIAATSLFQETAATLKEQHKLLLTGVMNGATPLTGQIATNFQDAKDKENLLRDSGFQNADQISAIFSKLEVLTARMTAELDKVEKQIGPEKFAVVLQVIDSEYKDSFTLSAQEALELRTPDQD